MRNTAFCCRHNGKTSVTCWVALMAGFPIVCSSSNVVSMGNLNVLALAANDLWMLVPSIGAKFHPYVAKSPDR
jgi:hypothetical protein